MTLALIFSKRSPVSACAIPQSWPIVGASDFPAAFLIYMLDPKPARTIRFSDTNISVKICSSLVFISWALSFSGFEALALAAVETQVLPVAALRNFICPSPCYVRRVVHVPNWQV